ncbi:female-specific protein transformer-like isoform X2 [Polistes fuscatus]|uniref:female-specific protein transformer-like isoform X2 n=1 Tax=Polistes fuscatus TaxID=30207 RepID=UPI001CA94605|nr:female-specific protein transformer-like isoform X2 [Polistes fuscatus]
MFFCILWLKQVAQKWIFQHHRNHNERIKLKNNSKRNSDDDKQRRREKWMIRQKLEKEHEKLKRKKILEYESKRAHELNASISRGRSANESDSKTRDRSLEKKSLEKKTKATSSKSSVMAEKLDTSGSGGSTTIFQGPEGIKISEKELHCIKVNVHRNLSVETPSSELNRDIIKPEEVVIIRRSGEGSKPIFEREKLQSSSKKHKEIEERRTVMAIESGDTGNKSESFRRHSPPSNLLRHRSQCSSSSRRSKSKESNDSSYKSDRNISKKSDRRQSRERYRERDRRDSEHDRPSSSSNRYRSSQNRESSYREYRSYRRNSSPKQDFSHRSESRRGDKEEESSSSSKFRNYSSNRERRSRSRSRSRDSRYRERQMVPSYCVDQMPYPVYYGPQPMMMGPMMPIRGQVPMPRGGGLPPSLIGPIRPFPSRFMPPSVFGLRPPSNYRFGPML